MGRIWESINASNQHMLTHVPSGQIAGSPLCNVIQAARPQTLIKKLQIRVLSLEAELQDVVDSGIMAQADPVFTAHIERSMGR